MRWRQLFFLSFATWAGLLGCQNPPRNAVPDQGFVDLTPLPAPRGVDILVVSSVPDALSYASEATARLRNTLLPRLTHTSPADVRLGVIPSVVDGAWCDTTTVSVKAGLLSPNSSGEVMTNGERDGAAWQDQFRFITRYCWLQQPFEAARLALDGRNPGFPRPDALLVVLMFTDQDDCSVANPDIFAQPSLFPADLAPSYYARCQVAPKGLLKGVSGYIDALLQAHPQRIFVGAVASSDPVTWIPDGPYVNVGEVVTCDSLKIRSGPRFGHFFDAIEARKHPRLRGVLNDSVHGVCPWEVDVFARDIVAFGDL